jgi:hypothetical protein
MIRSTGRSSSAQSPLVHFRLGSKNAPRCRHRGRRAGALERLEGRLMLSTMQMSGGAGCGCAACAAAAQALNDATTEPANLPLVVNQIARSNAASARMYQPLSALPAARGRASDMPLGAYAPFTVDQARLTGTLRNAPREFTAQAKTNPLTLSLPAPNGTYQRFAVVETQVLAPELAARFPDIKTYVAKGIDDPNAVARIDTNPFTGLHAMVLGGRGGTWAIDNYFRNDKSTFVSYFKHDLNRVNDFKCLTVPTANDAPVFPGAGPEGGPENIPAGDVLRTFRLAVTTTTGYNSFHGNSVPSVLSAVTTAVNRITGVYEKDLSTRLQLVANTDLLFSNLNGNPNLSTSTSVSTLANANQAYTDGRIGFANYDVGHVFAQGANNGVSAGGIGIVGSSAKARACSMTSPPSGDLFAVDYVAHEMGHQFNGRHNFSNCSGPGDSGSIANEPGSGATIMGYAGICGSNNLQPNSDAMFNHINYNQMYPYILNTIPSVGTTTPTGNNAPTVNAGADYIIPARTPYALTASGTDPNGDPLTWSWEQMDTGGSLPINNTTGTTGPVVRTWLPSNSPTRTIPRPVNLLSNTTAIGEVLTQVDRFMNFRVVARDGRGGVNFDDMNVRTINTGAAFAVTSPNTSGLTWNAGTTQTVSWNVAGTDTGLISTANVSIKLSTDGGNTYPITLSAGTPNDGSENITVPANLTSLARVRVEAVGNIYFDLSNFNFTIAQPPTTPAQPVLAPGSDSGVSNSDRITNFDNSSPARALELTIGDTIAGATVTVYADGVPIGSAVATGTTTTVVTDGVTTLANGVRQITARQTPVSEPQSPDSIALAVTIDTVAPALVTSPAFNFLGLPHSVTYGFDENVGPSLASGDFAVTRLPGTNVPVDVAYNAGSNVATLTFGTSQTILTDGRYTANVNGGAITDVAGNALPAVAQLDFFFLMGDANRDARVDLADFDILAANFGQSPRDFTQGDFNYSGNVNLDDFNLLASRFGAAVAPAGVTGRPGSALPPVTDTVDDLEDLLA